MRVLIVKTSSMGDVLHTLPALTDAGKALGNVQFDWVVEERFAEIPSWHPLVDRVIPIAWRRWRKHIVKAIFSQEFRDFFRKLRERQYDVVIDAQGLIKSAVVSRLSRGKRIGLDKQSLWEPLSRFAYQQHCSVDPELHAVTRVRQLFSQALGYQLTDQIDYGINKKQFATNHLADKPYVLFIHGTTWKTKLWPEIYWQSLAKKVEAAGYEIKLPWGNKEEKARAERIASSCQAASVLKPMDLVELAGFIAHAKVVVAVDTGLGHLSAAFSVPTISLYGPTDPAAIGTIGERQVHLHQHVMCAKQCNSNHCAKKSDVKPACFAGLDAEYVFHQLSGLI